MGLMHDKVVLVTGASQGIGASCAYLFAQNGAGCVFLVDTEYGSVEQRSLDIAAKTGVKCVPVKADMAKEREVRTVFDIVRDIAGKLDILVNCTGIERTGADEGDVELWDFALSRGLRSAFVFSREAVRIMRKQKSGTIISVVPQPDGHGYAVQDDGFSSGKEGLVYLTKTLAKRSGKYGITVKGVSARLAMSGRFVTGTQNVPMLCDTAVRGVADTVLFLASDHAKYMTGTCVDVDCPLAM